VSSVPPETLGLRAQLRRSWRWVVVGLFVAGLVTASRFGTIGVLPPSFTSNQLGYSTASTSLVTSLSSAVAHGVPDRYVGNIGTRSAALGDIAGSPEIIDRIARATGIPASRIRIDAPPWADLQRAQQWATGEKRASQLVAEMDPYRISMSDDPNSPVVDLTTQAPTVAAARRLADAVAPALSSYVAGLEATSGTPVRERFRVNRLTPIATTPASKGQLLNVGAFTFVAVVLLWCAGVLAVGRLVRDLRALSGPTKVLRARDRSVSS